VGGPGRHEPGPHGPRLRAVASAIVLVGAVAAAIVFAVGAQGGGSWTAAGVCAGVAVLAAVDLVVIARRTQH
jgi:NADH:ubiquinone oxidoreductase subunit 6 (subunit J)